MLSQAQGEEAYLRHSVHLSIGLALKFEDRIPALEIAEFWVSDYWTCSDWVTKAAEKGSIPNLAGPLAGTILPGVRPWKRIGSWPGPEENANVQTAEADLSSYAERRLFKPVRPRASRNHLLPAERGQLVWKSCHKDCYKG